MEKKTKEMMEQRNWESQDALSSRAHWHRWKALLYGLRRTLNANLATILSTEILS